MKLKDIIDALEAVVLDGLLSEETDINWACATDLMSEVLYYSHHNSILLTGLAKSQVIRTAEIADIKVIAFTRGKEPDLETVELAKRKGITLLVTPLSLFSASGKLFEKGLLCCPDNK